MGLSSAFFAGDDVSVSVYHFLFPSVLAHAGLAIVKRPCPKEFERNDRLAVLVDISPLPSHAALGTEVDGSQSFGEICEAIVLWFDGPLSFRIQIAAFCASALNPQRRIGYDKSTPIDKTAGTPNR